MILALAILACGCDGGSASAGAGRAGAAAAAAAVAMRNRGVRAPSAWPSAGIFPDRWRPVGPRASLTPGAGPNDLSHWVASTRSRLDMGGYLFPAPLPTTWEREHRLMVSQAAGLLLDRAARAPEATRRRAEDVAFALAGTDAAIAAASGHDPNRAIFDRLARDDRETRRRAEAIWGHMVKSYGATLASGATLLEIANFFYDTLAHRVDWSFRSAGAGPALHLRGMPWTPTQAERIVENAWIATRPA